LYVPNAGVTGFTNVFNVAGNTDTPALDLVGNRISRVGTAATSGDVAPYVPWTTWSPTVTWTSAPVTLGGFNTSRYARIGNTVSYHFECSYTNSRGGYMTQFTLPYNSAAYATATGREIYGAAGATIGIVLLRNTISSNIALMQVNNAGTSGQLINYLIDGTYEAL